MGKSAAALAIAARTSAIYIDLSLMQVGTGTLTGELTKVLGWDQTPKVVSDLKAGRTALVLDSTDEAQLAAGRDNYVALLADLAWLLKDATAASQVVLLGRPDSIDTTYVELLDLGFDPPLQEVSPLSRSQACDLIDSTLDRAAVDGRPFNVHRIHREPFGLLRDSVFDTVAASLGADSNADYWDDLGGFLGYPPVVQAIAQRLAVDNPSHELSEGNIASIATRHRQGDLLQKVLEDILDREHSKVRTRLGDRIGMHRDDPQRAILYTRGEQIARLLVHVGPLRFSVALPATLAPAEQAKYEEDIESFLVDHPFLATGDFANIVFSDYVRAWAVCSPEYSVYAGSRGHFLAALPKAGPFFAHFVHSMTANSSDTGSLAEDLVDDVLHSFALGVPNGRSVYNHKGERGSLLLYGEESDGRAEGVLLFSVAETTGVLTLTSPLARLTCVTEHGVVLSSPNGHFDLGPSVALFADSLQITAKSVAAWANNREPNDFAVSMLHANTVEHSADMRVSSYPERALLITWANPWHQWKPFAVNLDLITKGIPADVASQALLGIRRILTSFGSSVTSDPSVLDEKIERFAIGSNPVFRATLDALVELEVINQGVPLYRLRLDQLAKFGVSWAAMRADPGRALEQLHSAVVSTSHFDGFRAGPTLLR